MSTKKPWVLGLLLAGGLSFAATAPVAMRVEVEPTRQAGALTEVVVVVQVSPEDRLRIGSNAILRIELDGGTVSSGSPMRAVRLEDDGSARVVVEWPPGEHHLRVGIEDPSKEDTGLWVGTVRIPDLGPDANVKEIDEPQSDPDPDPDPDPDAPDPVVPSPDDSENAPDEIDAPAAASTPAVIPADEPASEPAPAAQEPEAAEVTAEPTPEATVADTPTIVESAAVSATALPEISEPVTEEIPVEIERAEPPQIEEPAEVVEEPTLVEPLRADPPQPTAQPEAVAPRQQEEPVPAMVPVSADLAARYEEWGSADTDTREFSVVMLRGREPAKNVDVTGLRLRVGGSEVPVEKLGDLESAPLLLGLVIDVEPGEIEGWSGMQGSLSPIVERAGERRGRLFVANPRGVGDWDAEFASPRGSVGSGVPMNVSQLVIASLERFEGQRGRTFLVLLTDGRDEPSKEEWQRAFDSAGAAGVPILVIALWDDGFRNRTRKNLKKLTEISGGSIFLVQGRAQLESAADRFSRYLDGGYSIRFRSPDGERKGLTPISVIATNKEVDVSAPKSIR